MLYFQLFFPTINTVEQRGATAAKPPVPTTTRARGAAEPRDIHLTRPAAWTQCRWKNCKRNHWSRAPKSPL